MKTSNSPTTNRIGACLALLRMRGRTHAITTTSFNRAGVSNSTGGRGKSGQGDVRLRSQYQFFQVQDLHVGPGAEYDRSVHAGPDNGSCEFATQHQRPAKLRKARIWPSAPTWL